MNVSVPPSAEAIYSKTRSFDGEVLPLWARSPIPGTRVATTGVSFPNPEPGPVTLTAAASCSRRSVLASAAVSLAVRRTLPVRLISALGIRIAGTAIVAEFAGSEVPTRGESNTRGSSSIDDTNTRPAVTSIGYPAVANSTSAGGIHPKAAIGSAATSPESGLLTVNELVEKATLGRDLTRDMSGVYARRALDVTP
jgi:hypothetical protein